MVPISHAPPPVGQGTSKKDKKHPDVLIGRHPVEHAHRLLIYSNDKEQIANVTLYTCERLHNIYNSKVHAILRCALLEQELLDSISSHWKLKEAVRSA